FHHGNQRFVQLIREMTTSEGVHQLKRGFITGITICSPNSRNDHERGRSSAKPRISSREPAICPANSRNDHERGRSSAKPWISSREPAICSANSRNDHGGGHSSAKPHAYTV